jgi:predicted small metal-binding protein
MAKSISCKDVGMNCDFTAKAETTEELLQAAAAHAKEAHGLDSIPAELMPMVHAAIRDE